MRRHGVELAAGLAKVPTNSGEQICWLTPGLRAEENIGEML